MSRFAREQGNGVAAWFFIFLSHDNYRLAWRTVAVKENVELTADRHTQAP
jgi:hypothetical protein